MKTAILISGELRTFSICRPTMTFLDDPNADIYVSTWDQSIVKNERINLFINDEVSEDNILKILNRPATVMVEPLSCIEEKKYNTKMIHRWLAGFQMILDSGTEYDYVLVTRPDLYFNHTHTSMFTLDSLITDGDEQFAWYEEGHKLQDNLFFAKFDTMKELFSRLSIKDWEDSDEGDWHTWWTNFVSWTDIKRLGKHVSFTFCRSITKVDANFQDVVSAGLDWRDIGIVDWILKYNDRKSPIDNWGENVVIEAEKKWNEGYFEHYRVVAPKIAVLISGEYRTFASCRKTMKFLEDLNVDVFFSTWVESHVVNSIRGIDKHEYITPEKIEHDLGFKPYGLILEENVFTDNRYNSNFTRRLEAGLDYIRREHCDEYNYIMVVRPDLFFGQSELCDISMDKILKSIGDSNLLVTASSDLDKGRLGDVCFIGSAADILNIGKNLTSKWNNHPHEDWHKFWFEHVSTFCKKINQAPVFLNDSTVNRSFIFNPSYSLVLFNSRLWVDSVACATADNEKTCLVISGMLRNYDAAALSLPIWGEMDTYLCTWSNASQNDVKNYEQMANIKRTFIIDNEEFETVYKDPYNRNPFRMVYLWEKCAELLPKNYDKYIFIRPDGYYWTERAELVRQIIRDNTFCVNQTQYKNTTGLNDHVLIASRSELTNLSDIHKKMLSTAIKFSSTGRKLCVHSMLWEIWGNKSNICSAELDYLIDTLFVRDTFKLRTMKNFEWITNEDEYNYKLYKAIFYDTAARWRRWTGTDYENTLRVENYTTL